MGIFIAKAIVDGHILGVTFSPLLLTTLRGTQPTVDDLRDSDYDFFSGLRWIEQNDVSSADLFFNVSFEDYLGVSKTVSLGDYGDSAKVTEENKVDYVRLMLEWRSRTRFEPCLSYLLDGFYSILEVEDLKNFTNKEIQM